MATEATPPEGEETPEETPETPINADNDVEEIAAKAENPDAVSKAIKAERESAKKAKAERDEALARIREFEDAQKTEAEKREEALESARKEVDDYKAKIHKLEVDSLRSQVAAEKNLPPKLAARLTGETIEDITADADSLLEDLSTVSGGTPPPGDGGARTPVQPKDLNDQIREAEAAGDYRKSMSLKNQKLLANRA